MEIKNESAVLLLASLAQEHRLAVFRLLVQTGPGGAPAGAIANSLDIPNSSLSFHLAQLRHAGLIGQRREGRKLIYAANYDIMTALLAYLMENCCGDASCAPFGELSDIMERKNDEAVACA